MSTLSNAEMARKIRSKYRRTRNNPLREVEDKIYYDYCTDDTVFLLQPRLYKVVSGNKIVYKTIYDTVYVPIEEFYDYAVEGRCSYGKCPW